MKTLRKKPKSRPAGAAIAADVHKFILTYYKQHGFMPTLTEISDNWKHPKQWAFKYLRVLEAKGKIKLVARQHRGIVLI